MRAAAFLLLIAVPALAQEQVWRWVDDAGEEHYTNDRTSIPEKARAKATSTEGTELSVISTAPGGGNAFGPTRPAAAPAPPANPQTPPARPNGGVNRLVLFEASTNSASKTLKRSGVVEKLVSDNPGLKLERLEFANAVDRAEQLHVNEIPTVLFLDDSGAERGRFTGLGTLKQLQQQLDKARGTLR